MPRNDKPDVLKLRLVCIRWMLSVDNCLSTLPALKPYYYLADETPKNLLYYSNDLAQGYNVYLEGGDAINLFSNHLDFKLVRNPIIGRSLTVSNLLQNRKNDAHCAKFFENLLDLLKKVGRFVWYFKLDFCFPNLSQTKLYLYVYHVLTLLPSIKTFELSGSTVNLESLSSTAELSFIIDKHPLPRIHSLEILKLCATGLLCKFEGAFFEAYGLCVKSLELDDLHCRHVNLCHYFPFLTELRLNRIDNMQLIKPLITNLANQNVPLQKFVGAEGKAINILGVLDILTDFPLIEVELYGENSVQNHNMECISSLRVLKIIDGEWLGYNFLKSLPYLESLHVSKVDDYIVRDLKRQGITKTIFECLYIRKLPPLEFWKSLPHLKFIYVYKVMSVGAVPDFVFSRYDS